MEKIRDEDYDDEVDIEPEVADYLQTIAWETRQDKHAKRTETEQ